MKKKIALYVMIFISSIINSQNASFEWAVGAPGTGFSDLGKSIALDSQGNSYITGTFEGTATFGSTTLSTDNASFDDDIFVAKLNAAGQYVWAVRAGGNRQYDMDESNCIKVDSEGNSYITGKFEGTASFGNIQLTSQSSQGDIFVAKLNPEGIFLWAVRAGGYGASVGTSLALGADGDIYVSGSISNTSYFGNTTINPPNFHAVFIAKLNQSGNFVWVSTANPTEINANNIITSLSTDPQGNTYITGQINRSITIGQTTLTATAVGGDIFVAKVNNAGQFQWAVRAGNTSYSKGTSIATDIEGNSYVTGLFDSPINFGNISINASGSLSTFVVKINTIGIFVWGTKIDNTFTSYAGYANGSKITVDNRGNSYVSGYFDSQITINGTTLAGYGDIYITKLNNSGSFMWAVKAGGPYNGDDVNGIVCDNNGNAFITGRFQRSATFGDKSLTSQNVDIFTAKISGENLGIPYLNQNKLVLYPNPASSQITIMGILNAKAKSCIYNLLGQKVMDINATDETVDVSHLPEGNYILEVDDNQTKTRLTFIKL